jgi:hypothetical protein
MKTLFSKYLLLGSSTLILALGFSGNALATDCIVNVQGSLFRSNTNWISPYSGVAMVSPGTLHSESQYFDVGVYYRGTCLPSNVSADLSSVPAGINMTMYQNFLNTSMSNDPSLKVTYANYFVSIDPSVPEGAVNLNIPILEGGAIKATVTATLNVDKTPPQTVNASDVLLNCTEVNLAKEEHIRVELAPPPIQPAGQSPIQMLYAYDSNGQQVGYALYDVNSPSRGSTLLISTKDYGKPLRFKYRDQAMNFSAPSQEFVFSHDTLDSRFNKRLNSCIAK